MNNKTFSDCLSNTLKNLKGEITNLEYPVFLHWMLYGSLYQFVVNNNSVKTLLIMYIHLFPSKLKHIFLSFKNKHKIWRKKSKIFLGKSIFSFAKVHIYKIKYMHVYVNKSIILLDITNFVWVRSTIYIYINIYMYMNTCF